MRISSRVWPIWLPRAVARAEKRVLTTNPRAAFSKKPKPVLFSSSLCSHYPESTAMSRTFKSSHQPISLQQLRPFSNSPSSPPPLQPSHDTPPSQQPWAPLTNTHSRPVAILGAGVLGRRLATLWSSNSRPVNLYDTSIPALTSATEFIADSLSTYCSEHGTHPGHVHFTTHLHDAVKDAWMVIEAVTESLELKISVLGRVDRAVSKEVIIATNSASFSSSELVSEVRNRERVLNTLYYIPPTNKCVEIMSCGYTAPELIPFLVEEMREIGLRPMVVGNESTGLIFPRIFAAMKRETLRVLEEGVARPEEVDELFKDFFGAEKGICEKMDEVGLDTVARTERHFLSGIKGEGGEGLWKRAEYLRWLEEEYVEKGKLGEKSGEGLLKRKAEKDIARHETPAQEVWKEHSVDLSGM